MKIYLVLESNDKDCLALLSTLTEVAKCLGRLHGDPGVYFPSTDGHEFPFILEWSPWGRDKGPYPHWCVHQWKKAQCWCFKFPIWNAIGVFAELLPMCLSNFKAIWTFQRPVARVRDFVRSYNKTLYHMWIEREPKTPKDVGDKHVNNGSLANFARIVMIVFATHKICICGKLARLTLRQTLLRSYWLW